jgi:hypothetical protein
LPNNPIIAVFKKIRIEVIVNASTEIPVFEAFS